MGAMKQAGNTTEVWYGMVRYGMIWYGTIPYPVTIPYQGKIICNKLLLF
jgi:hypothetical protein